MVAAGQRLALPPVPSSEATGAIGTAIIIGAVAPAGFVHPAADLIRYRIVIAVDAYRLPLRFIARRGADLWPRLRQGWSA